MAGKKEEEELSMGPLSVLMMSVKNNIHVSWYLEFILYSLLVYQVIPFIT